LGGLSRVGRRDRAQTSGIDQGHVVEADGDVSDASALDGSDRSQEALGRGGVELSADRYLPLRVVDVQIEIGVDSGAKSHAGGLAFVKAAVGGMSRLLRLLSLTDDQFGRHRQIVQICRRRILQFASQCAIGGEEMAADEATNKGTTDPAEVIDLATETLKADLDAAMVLEVPSERVVAASPSAALLLAPDGQSVIGRGLEEFTTDGPTGAFELFAERRINGYEAVRVLRRPDTDVKVKMWIRAFGHHSPSQFALVVMAPAEQRQRSSADGDRLSAVVGTAGENLIIERISSEAEDLFGCPATSIVGTPLPHLVAANDAADWLTAIEHTSAAESGVTLRVATRPAASGNANAVSVECDALIVPLHPAPSCAFVLLPIQSDATSAPSPSQLSTMLVRLRRAAELADIARGATSRLTERDIPGLSRLTSRELEITEFIVHGDRVPAIATQLFVAQSTVRTHLASIYEKLNVDSQQALLSLFRSAVADPDQ
jgi:DNA-binding CsgD family transcriptional regulator